MSSSDDTDRSAGKSSGPWPDAALSALPRKDGFRQRGLETTRLEVFTDAAFAFAMTMLVISIDRIPGNYEELLEALKGTPAFAASFATVMMFWVGHRTWSRRYGLENGRTHFVTLFMIFVMLVYVFPLRLLFSSLFNWLSRGWLPSEFELSAAPELTGLFVIYGIGFTALSGSMALLYWAALISKTDLALDPVEVLRTREGAVTWSIQAFTGIVSALWAGLLPIGLGLYAGFVYMSLPIVMPILATRYAQRAAELEGEV